MTVFPSDNRPIKIEDDVPATMGDGTKLRADVYRPDDDGRYPVLVCRTPYDKRRPDYIDTARTLAARGYIAVVQDLRGRYKSDGEFIWQFRPESETFDARDGHETIEWAAALKGSDGRAGTWGHSYPSWCVWRLAATRPPSLKALFASGMSARIRDLNFGIFETGRRLEWTYQMAVDSRLRRGDRSGPTEWRAAAEQWRKSERERWLWQLPLDSIPDHVFGPLTPQLKAYFRNQDKEFWAFDMAHQQVNVPTCQVTGWWDRLIGTIDNFTGMVANGPAGLRDQHRLVIGPWGHGNTTWTRRQGPLDLGPAADARYVDFVTRWYDYQFKEYDNGVESEPPIRLFVINANTWRYETGWPLPGTRFTEFHLHSRGNARTPDGDGTLSRAEPAGEPPDTFDYDPRRPVPSLMAEDAQAAPRDQSILDDRADILVYQTDPIEAELEVIGPVTLKLWAASSAPETDFTAKLVDVRPDGLAYNLCYGIVRSSYRDSYDDPRPIEPGKPYEYTIRMMPTGVLFRQGHRIRLDISSSDFPNFDRNHNTGRNFWSDSELRTAHQTVFHDHSRPSRLILPVVREGGGETARGQRSDARDLLGDRF